ncbi:NAD(P)/FAD-dependent oxidoreductase [Acidobacteriota bacterium]
MGSLWDSFDAFLLGLAREKGAHVERARVNNITWDDGRPRIHLKNGPSETYDLLVGAVGASSSALRLFEGLGFGFCARQS